MLKLAIPLKIWVPAPSEVSLCRICSPKIAVFRPFFGRKWSLTAKPSTFDPIVLYIIGKLCIWRVWNSGGKSIFDHRWSARIFVTHTDWIATLIRFLVIPRNTSLLGVGADMPENIFFSKFFPDTCFSLYFWILRGVSFLELFDLGPPSFAKMHIYVYIANLQGEVGQNILNGQKNMLKRWTCDFNAIHHLNIPILPL